MKAGFVFSRVMITVAASLFVAGAGFAQTKLQSKAPLIPKISQKVLIPAPAAPTSPLFTKKLNSGGKLRGLVDMHTHPMAHLGFGGKVIHGAPDVGVMMPPGAIYRPGGVGLSGATCNNTATPAKSVGEALGTCYSSHAGHDLIKNKCGNHVRRLVLNGFEDGEHTNKPHDVEHPEGYPAFTRWPKHNDILHQQMWVDWIKRAYDGGLRVMVALAVNNRTLAAGLEANEPTFDKDSGDLQLSEMNKFIAKHSWMKVARSASELRTIVGKDDKLAVIIGVELDDIGDFVRYRSSPSEAAVRAEIKRLHGKNVRYIFPVHVTDNHFGGTAVYTDEFNRANCFQYGSWWSLGCSNDANITHAVGAGWDAFKTMKLGNCGGTAPVPNCAGKGHINKRGLTALGKSALDEMMRLGMIIDIDHASAATVTGMINHTKSNRYPLVTGHNGLRGSNAESKSENSRTSSEYKELAARGSIAGVGWGDGDTAAWLASLKAVESTGIPLALGSDINGLVKMPPPRAACKRTPCVSYSASFPQATFGGKAWDYNIDGVAHIGLFPDALRDMEGQPGGAVMVNKLFNGAEAFAVMWEKSEAAGRLVPRPPPPGLTVTTADYGGNCNLPAASRNITRFAAAQCDGTQNCHFKLDWTPWGGNDPSPSLCRKQLVLKWRCPNGSSKNTTTFHQSTPQHFPLVCP